MLLDDTDEIVGRINVKNINAQDRSAELGYRLAMRHVGTGLATLALALVKDLALKQLGLKQLFAVVAQGNAASNRVLEKAGFVRMPPDSRPTYWLGTPLLRYRCDLADCPH